MKILFLFPIIDNIAAFNYGIGSIAAVLKQNGYKVKVFLVQTTNYKLIKKEIEKYKPDIIAISCYSNYWNYVKALSVKIKQDFNKLIFVGGTHPTLFPECIEETTHIDGICIGEGEFALLELISKIRNNEDYFSVKNFWFNKEGEITKNDIRKLIPDLDVLPFPDRSAFPKRVLLNYPNFTFSRGCPFSCAYCCNNKLNQIYQGKGPIIRFRSVENAIQDIEKFVKRYQPKYLCFDDDSFTKRKDWLNQFCHEYKRKINLPFNCNTRPELFNEEIAKLLSDSGCRSISIGIESGDEEFRKMYLNRHMSDNQIINAFNLAKKYKINTVSFNMIGMPFEILENFNKTIQLNKLIQPTRMQLSIYYPFPGTKLGDLCYDNEFVTNKEFFNFKYDSILKLPNFPKKQILKYARRFHYLVYKNVDFKKAIYYLLRRYFLFSSVYKVFNRFRNYLKATI